MKASRLAAVLAIGGLGCSALSSGAIAQNPSSLKPMRVAEAAPEPQSTDVAGVAVTAKKVEPLDSQSIPLPTMLSKMLLPFDPPKSMLKPAPGSEVAQAAAASGFLVVPDNIIELASVYRAKATGFANTNALFHSSSDVRTMVKATAAYQPEQLQQGMVAYAAMVALRQPDFVASVRAYVADKSRAGTLAEYMAINPASLDVPHMDKAAGMVITALDQLGAQVAVRGYMVKQAAYDTQLSSWALVKVSDNAARLDMAKQMSKNPQTAEAEDMAQLRRLATGEEPDVNIPGAPVTGPYRPVVSQALALAALIVAGKAGPENADVVKKLLTDDETAMCLNQAKTTLYECFSVAGPHYEDIFCSGQHSLIDTGMCMVKAAGAQQTAFIEPAHRAARKVEGDEGGKVIKAKSTSAPKKKKAVAH